MTGNPGNTGGKPGRSGRRSLKFSAFLAELREGENVQAAIERAATNEESRGFAPVLRTMTDYDPERPSEKPEVQGDVTIRIVRDGDPD